MISEIIYNLYLENLRKCYIGMSIDGSVHSE